jgi:carbon storage regulator
MLVLSRREGECIRIGESIVVSVVRLQGDKVRIGIDAPSDILVLRKELESKSDREGNIPLPAPPHKTAMAG